MKMSYLTFAILLAALTASVQAETINCTPITSLPATITVTGIYCLTGRLGTSQISGNAITINANDVTIDLNGWKVDDHSAGTGSQAVGIYSTANDVIIKNGLVHGFYIGIDLEGSGDVVQDVLADTNLHIGIQTTGPGALLEHNQVVNTGGTTNTSVGVRGIESGGTGATVSDNIVSGVTVTTSGHSEIGIGVNGANNIVRNNVVSNSALPSGSTSIGIYNYAGGIVLNNAVTTFSIGIDNNGGIYSYNTANGCIVAFSGGTAGAGNSSD